MKYFKVISALLISLSLVACSPAKLPVMNTYALNSVKPKLLSHSKTQKTLLVSLPLAGPAYGTDQMMYVTVPYKRQAFTRNRWVSTPSQMLMPILATSLRNQNYFKAVMTTPFGGMTDYRLDTQIQTFAQNFIQPVSRFEIGVQMTLVDARTNNPIASKTFDLIQIAPGNNPYSGVVAANRDSARLAKQVNQFVLSHV